MLDFTKYTVVIYNPKAFKKYILYRSLHHTVDHKMASANDGHLRYINTLMM